MKKAVMILFCVLSHFTLVAQNGVLEYLYFYNAGVTALEKGKYTLADSMFSASIQKSRTSEAYFNRALVKLKLGNHESFCNDMYMATANGDTTARFIFLGQCTLNDTIYRDSSGKDSLKIVALHKYDATIDVITRDNIGNEYWQYPVDTTVLSSADSAEFLKNALMPMFPGGDQGLILYLTKNIKFPPKALRDELQGEVILKYFVSREGTIEDITVFQSAGAELDQEAIRVVELMPQWFPGVFYGKFIGVPYNLPIKFTLR